MSRHRLDLPKVLEAFWAARGRLVGSKPLHLKKIAFLENLHPSWAIYWDGSKPCTLVNIKIAGKWMFIPLKMVCIGIDPYPYIGIWNHIP